MLGTGSNFRRAHGGDRFYSPAKARRSFHNTENDRLRRAHSDVTETRSVRDKSVDSANRVPENRVGSEEAKKGGAVPSCEPVVNRLSNLERFLQAITPSVPAQYLPKRTTRELRGCNVEFQPYFVLGDLWESFREWSAYGAGVPLVLNDKDSVVQYYVPYLSGIQIYSQNVKPTVKSRQLGEDSDSDFRDSSSDGSSDCEPVRGSGLKYMREQRNLPHLSDEVPQWMGRLSLRDHHSLPLDGFSSDDGESANSQGYLIFEYLERDPPYSREPLADKIMDLAFRFPELLTLRSCDILASSWISVAWYPIYRIPTGPTLKDLDACFLTYHSLYTPMGGSQRVQAPVSHPTEMDSVHKMSLPVFGFASYKFKGSLWTSNGGHERQLASFLLQAADKWLRLRQVSHPDFLFFSR
ncbi:Transducin/WD40 repeat superfamily protein [Spatholobus suberectus]|nr:Transducin/WD40 repeat superfamily protein [Spatholobus suberectus]